MPSYKQSQPESFGAWPAGEYTLEVVDAAEKVSQNGNDMIVLKCKVVEDGEVKGGKITDHLVFTPKAFFKVDEARAALGFKVIPDEEVDVEADDFIGKRGKAILGIQEGDDRWNEIVRWVLPTKESKPAPAKKATEEDGDEIPF
jgi:hypothetical protein